MTTDRTQPHDEQAERITLGCMMTTPGHADAAIDIIQSSADFHSPNHSAIYAAIVAALAANEPTDPTVVYSYLQRSGDATIISKSRDCAVYLAELCESVPITAGVGWYARRVVELATRRRIIAAGLRIVQRASNFEVDIDSIVNDAQCSIHLATTGRDPGSAVRLGDVIDQYVDDLFGGQRPQGCVSTGLTDLDAILGGHHPGQLIVVGARPGVGKTVLTMDFIRAAASVANKNGVPSMIFTLEMSKEEIIGRIVSAECRVDLTRITNRTCDDHDRRKVEARIERLRQTPIIIDDTPNMTLAGIRSASRRAVQKQGVGLIAVDYLQLMTGAKRSESRQQDVADISRGLKLLARELEIPVIACSQLNRSSESRSDKRPAMSDLRESGAVEQDADVVLLLHREDYHDKESPRAGEVDIIVAKNRFGPMDTVTCSAQLHNARIVDMAMPS
jgi:replicative DNA helicase